MGIIGSFIKGMFSVIAVTAQPQLYRYPYRTSAEGLRADMLRIGDDVSYVMEKLKGEAEDGRE